MQKIIIKKELVKNGKSNYKKTNRAEGCLCGKGAFSYNSCIVSTFCRGIGAHKFYLGQTSKGILMLLTFWTFVPAFIAFVEFILLLCMSNKDFDKKFNNIIVQNS